MWLWSAAALGVALLACAASSHASEESVTRRAETDGQGWHEAQTLSGEWGGGRSRLKEHGITLDPRLTWFHQGMTSGDGVNEFADGAKADLLLHADLGKSGFWDGFSLTIHAEYNLGRDVNGAGGTIMPVNTGLLFPGIEGSDAFDLSSVFLGQTFGDSVTLLVGKINVVDLAAGKPFMGGAGVDSFWSSAFAAPPSGTVPPYLVGAIVNIQTTAATYGLWVYDPDSATNKSGFEDPFENGMTMRGTVDFPVTLGGLPGHQGFVALYSTKGASADFDGIRLPESPPGIGGIKEHRYYFGYTFDQYLYQTKNGSGEGFGLFGQFGISDGNPNRLYLSALIGIGGKGLIPGRSHDNWGIAFYYYAPSDFLKDSLEPIQTIRDEQGLELFYNLAVTPWMSVGADLQVIRPSLSSQTATFCGLRTVIRF